MTFAWKRRIIFYLLSFVIGVVIWKFNAAYYSDPSEPEAAVKKSALFGGRNEVLVFVGDSPITQEDLDWEIDQYLRTIPVMAEDGPEMDQKTKDQLRTSLREKLLENTIERKLLIKSIEHDRSFTLTDEKRYHTCETEFQEAVGNRVQNGEITKGEKRLRDYLCEKSLITQYFDEVVYSKITVIEPEVKDYFEKNKAKFNLPERVQIRQILLPNESEAKKVRARVNANNFIELAKTMGIAPEAENGGKIKPYARGTLPSVFDTAFTMKAGEISPIQKSNYGFHIIMLERKLPKVEANLDAERPRIVKELKEQKKHDEFKKQLDLAFNSVQVRRPRPLW